MSAPALKVSGLTKRFRGVPALDDVYLDVAPGEVVTLIGPSGCGKSTFLRCLTWLEEPDEGFIEVGGRPFGRARIGTVVRRQGRREIDALRPKIGLVFQSLNLWPHLTALENVARGPVVVLGRARAAAEARARTLLARLGLTGEAAKFPHALSGGQRQRVAIARTLAMDPELILFDEPTSALDPELVGEVLGLLREIAATGMTMLVVTHEIGFAAGVADRIAFMDRGRLVETGPARQVLDHPADPRLREFLGRVLSSRTGAHA